jgi:hypothetical protein
VTSGAVEGAGGYKFVSLTALTIINIEHVVSIVGVVEKPSISSRSIVHNGGSNTSTVTLPDLVTLNCFHGIWLCYYSEY